MITIRKFLTPGRRYHHAQAVSRVHTSVIACWHITTDAVDCSALNTQASKQNIRHSTFAVGSWTWLTVKTWQSVAMSEIKTVAHLSTLYLCSNVPRYVARIIIPITQPREFIVRFRISGRHVKTGNCKLFESVWEIEGARLCNLCIIAGYVHGTDRTRLYTTLGFLQMTYQG